MASDSRLISAGEWRGLFEAWQSYLDEQETREAQRAVFAEADQSHPPGCFGGSGLASIPKPTTCI